MLYDDNNALFIFNYDKFEPLRARTSDDESMVFFVSSVGTKVFRPERYRYGLRTVCSAASSPTNRFSLVKNLGLSSTETEIAAKASLAKVRPVTSSTKDVTIAYSLLEKLCGILKHEFKDCSTLATAMVHKSVIGNPKSKHKVYCEITPGVKARILENNERLELLGDRVLALLVSEHLTSSHDLTVGEMGRAVSSICSRRAVSYYCSALDLERFIVISARAVEKNKFSRGDFLEAFLGAIFIDGGLEAAENFFNTQLKPLLPSDHVEYKSVLQELLAIMGLPTHKISNFVQYVSLDSEKRQGSFQHTRAIKLLGRTVTRATGPSHKFADQKAAQQLVHMLKKSDGRANRILRKLATKFGYSLELE